MVTQCLVLNCLGMAHNALAGVQTLVLAVAAHTNLRLIKSILA